MDAAEPLHLRAVDGSETDDAEQRPMWHITLTVAGPAVPESVIREALERLSHEHPFLLSGRYAVDRAEVRYWEEAADVAAALRLAVLLWDEHLATAQLPPWRVVGVEVVDRDTFHRRGRHAHGQAGLVAAGRVVPF
jgi:hypothetical protein